MTRRGRWELVLAGAVLGAVISGVTVVVARRIVGPEPRPTFAATAEVTYVSPACERLTRLSTDWLVLMLSAADGPDSVERADVERLIGELTEVTPALPPEVQPEVEALVTSLVQLRGLLLTRQRGRVDVAAGEGARLDIQRGCQRQ